MTEDRIETIKKYMENVATSTNAELAKTLRLIAEERSNALSRLIFLEKNEVVVRQKLCNNLYDLDIKKD